MPQNSLSAAVICPAPWMRIIVLLGMLCGCGQSPDSPAVILERARILMDRGQATDAIPLIGRIISDHPEDAEAYYLRGLAHERLGALEKAIEDYSSCIGIDSDRTDAMNNRAVVFARMERFDEAAAEFTRLIERDPQDPMAWRNRGLCYADLGNVDASLKDYDKAIELVPDDPASWFQRGNVFLNRDEFEKAEQDYTRAIERDPRLARAYMNRCVARYHLGRRTEAGEDLQQAQSLDDNIVLPGLDFFADPVVSKPQEAGGTDQQRTTSDTGDWEELVQLVQSELSDRGYSTIQLRDAYPALQCGTWTADRDGVNVPILVTCLSSNQQTVLIPSVGTDLAEIPCTVMLLEWSQTRNSFVIRSFLENISLQELQASPVLMKLDLSRLSIE